MRFGVLNFSVGPFARLAARWRAFEDLGFDDAWLADDLALRGYAEAEAWTLLGALARETRRIRIGTLVSTIRIRHPTFLAAQVVTLDQVSDGRAALGIGAGEPQQNATVGNGPWSARETLERLAEQAKVLDVLLRGDPIDHAGPYYPTVVVAMPQPVTRPRPPIVIAAHGPTGMRAAGRHADRWNCLGGQVYDAGPNPDPSAMRTLPEAVAETCRLLDRLEAACAEVGRDPTTLGRSVLAYRSAVEPFASLDAFDAVVGAYAEAGIDEMVLYWPPLEMAFGDPPSRAEEARFERIAAERILARPAATPTEA
jgi:alkanesulfonate monooxygenase SsuD/methylene tetrahydromethanopterin reductase-like flavin-dependent oxidoreductase (luciferase family)